MAGYDINKLRGIIHDRDMASAVLRSISERYRDEKERASTLRQSLLRDAHSKAVHIGIIDHLLNLPPDQAVAKKAKEIEEFSYRMNNGADVSAYTGLNWMTYLRYIEHRDRFAFLSREREEKQRDFQARFAIVPRLLDAVVQWRFQNPEDGLLMVTAARAQAAGPAITNVDGGQQA